MTDAFQELADAAAEATRLLPAALAELGARELTHATGGVAVTVTFAGQVTELDLRAMPRLGQEAAGARIAAAMRAAQREAAAVFAEESASVLPPEVAAYREYLTGLLAQENTSARNSADAGS